VALPNNTAEAVLFTVHNHNHNKLYFLIMIKVWLFASEITLNDQLDNPSSGCITGVQIWHWVNLVEMEKAAVINNT